ncbi:MAG: hypothetical protein LBG57_09945 [Treponema sp.]|jgi:hypothetical protein|nr:hypothetical protein [Treponema sp.]
MRKIVFFMLCLFIIFPLTGCTKYLSGLAGRLSSRISSAANEDENEDDREADAVKYGADTAYHNSFLGFSYTVPKGWWLYRVFQDNFSADPEETADIGVLDINYGEDAGMDFSYIGLISFANLQFSSRDNHLGFYISAETLDGIGSIAEYMEYYENYMLEPDANEYRLLDSGRVEINGLFYERRVFEVIRKEDNYNFFTFTREVDNGYYLSIKVTYWPENKSAEDVILKALSKAMP